MTIVYCWFDQSLSRQCITALADSRISEKTKGGWRPLQEQTIKLFSVPVCCYKMTSLDFQTGAWREPYFRTELGLAFSGDCFQAQAIVNAFLRVASQLVLDGEDEKLPTPSGLYRLLREVAQNWLATYQLSVPDVQLLLFGFSPQDKLPWAGRLKWPEMQGPQGNQFEHPLTHRSVFIVGAEARPGGLDYADKLRNLFMRKAGKLNLAELQKAGFEPDLEQARLLNADRMMIEDDVASLLMADAHATIGGVMQKLEVSLTEGGIGETSFSTDAAAYLEPLTDVAPGLAYRSVSSLMGSAGRPRDWSVSEA